MSGLGILQLDGLNALVTGGGSGIGRQIALGFAEAGANLVLVGRRLAPLEESAKLAATFGVKSIVIAADITNEDDMKRIEAQAGRVDILLNCAGAAPNASWKTVSLKEWREVFAINVDAMFRLCQIFAPKMMDNGYGRIINISSVYGSMGGNPALYPGMDWDVASYFASKHAVHGITHYLAPRLAPFNVCINTLSPGGFSGSDMNEDAGMGSDEMLEAFYSVVPMRRLGGPKDIAAAGVFLASPGASYTTGQDLKVDGGWSVW